MSSAIINSATASDELLQKFKLFFKLQQPTKAKSSEIALEELFRYITSTQEGQDLLKCALYSVGRDNLRLPKPELQRMSHAGFKQQVSATTNITGFLVYLIFDLDASTIQRSGSGKCGGYFGVCVPTEFSGVLYYDDANDLKGDMHVEINLQSTSGTTAMNINFLAGTSFIATFVGTGEASLAGIGVGQFEWK